MRFKTFLAMFVILALAASLVSAQTEEEVVQKYMSKFEKKQTKKLAWVSGSYTLNRINRDNDYNKFANYETNNLVGGEVSWLGQSNILGLEMGLVFNQRFAWSIGGEYWLKFGEDITGSFSYIPASTSVDNPSSKIQVYGITTGLQYYIMNPPNLEGQINGLAIRVGGGVGLYQVKWDLWDDYGNLNLSTSTSEAENATFKDNGPGFSLDLGIDYPLNVMDLNLGIDFSYLYLNFDNVSWYNSQDDEIIASYDGTPDGRVDLGLSGFLGKVEIKKFFSW